jgi:hypothetical protein
MLKSATVGELVKAIAEAQTDYQALVARHTAKIPGKDGKSGYEYAYADLNDGLDALQSTLNSRGVAVIQEAYTVDRGVEVVTTLAMGEQWMEARPLFMPVSGGAQAVGSAITYARRYSLFPMVGLAPADDDGEEANRNAPPPPSKPAVKPRPAKPSAAEVRADALGPRCSGKAARLGEAIDERMQVLHKMRKVKLADAWADVLAEAGIETAKYGDGALPPAALTVADGEVVRAYLVNMLGEIAGETAEQPKLDAAGLGKLRAECQKLYNRLCDIAPDDFAQGAWKAEWSRMADVEEWPDQPTEQHYRNVRAGLTQAVRSVEA